MLLNILASNSSRARATKRSVIVERPSARAVMSRGRQTDTLSDTLTDGRKRKRADELAAKPVVLRGEDIASSARRSCRRAARDRD